MKIGKNKLRMSDGTTRTFRSEKARDSFERVASAVKHGWRPTNRKAKGAVAIPVSHRRPVTKRSRGR